MTMLTFRVDDEQAEELRHWAQTLGLGRSELLRQALRRHLVALHSEQDAVTWRRLPATDDEQVIASIGDWGPAEDWSDWDDATR